MKTVTASTKRFMILIMALLVTASVTAQKLQHMTFDGIPITGTYAAFTKKLMANKKYKLEDNSFVGVSSDLGIPCDIQVIYTNDTERVWGLCIALHDEHIYGNYEKIKNRIFKKVRANNPSNVSMKENLYQFDNNNGFWHISKACQISVGGKGEVRLLVNTCSSESYLEIAYISAFDASYEKNDHRFLHPFDPTCGDIDNTKYYVVPKMKSVKTCLLTEDPCSSDVFVCGRDNINNSYKIQPIENDKKIILDLVKISDKEIISDIMDMYVNSVVSTNPSENVVTVTDSRMEGIVNSYINNKKKLQAQQQQQRKEMVQASILMYLISGMFSKTNSNDIPPTTNDMILNPSKYNEYYYGR